MSAAAAAETSGHTLRESKSFERFGVQLQEKPLNKTKLHLELLVHCSTLQHYKHFSSIACPK
jgi:hypothetical protein